MPAGTENRIAKRESELRLIGVIHLLPLPGAPRYGGNMDEIVRRAVADARVYERAGFDAIEIENYGDLPFTKGRVEAATVAAMTRAALAVREAVSIPIGLNVLRNDALSALAIASVVGARFIRVNVLTGAMMTDQGVIEGNAYEVQRLRARLFPIQNPKSKIQNPEIFADVHVKHAAPLAPLPIEIAAHDCLLRGMADGLILTGPATGAPVDLENLRRVREALPKARLLVGSGATPENVAELFRYADGIIVGTYAKRDGLTNNPVDPARARQLRRAVDRAQR
ncbi:MAG: BtpA/SgcQ family protein [Verrucomicrobia bacterium]|nr:BtpA/SgcQ family protein [Verrucomicrobiota bacterium]